VAANIHVEMLQEGEYRVRVREGSSETVHTVTLQRSVLQKLAGVDASPEDMLRLSFEFLLEREPKESILARFDVPVISRYFPEYEREIRRKLQTHTRSDK
jgi:hypothetical protein